MKMALAVGPRRWRFTRTVLRHKALHRCPSLNLRAVDGKVVVRKQGSHLPMSEKLGQEFARHLGFEQPVAVLWLKGYWLGAPWRSLGLASSRVATPGGHELDHKWQVPKAMI